MVFSKEDVIKMFQDAQKKGIVNKYIKSAKIIARSAIVGEKIVTIINGEKETENTANEGDYIITNPSGEQYILPRKMFIKRYRLIDSTSNENGYSQYQALGSCWAFQYSGESFTFLAPWNEEMIVNDGDFIAVTSMDDLNDIYRIKFSEFQKTYKIQ